MTIREEIGKRILFFDGGMGTLLQEQGLQAGELPETWNLKNPAPIIQIHKAYFCLLYPSRGIGKIRLWRLTGIYKSL